MRLRVECILQAGGADVADITMYAWHFYWQGEEDTQQVLASKQARLPVIPPVSRSRVVLQPGSHPGALHRKLTAGPAPSNYRSTLHCERGGKGKQLFYANETEDIDCDVIVILCGESPAPLSPAPLVYVAIGSHTAFFVSGGSGPVWAHALNRLKMSVLAA